VKTTYEEYLAENIPCRGLASDPDARAIFEMLSEDKRIIDMIDASEAGKPALTPVVSIVENYYDLHRPATFDLRKKFPRSAVGCMVKSILSAFGYLPVRPATRTQKELPKSAKPRYFTSSACYAYEETAPATMRIVRAVEEIA